MDIPKHFMTKGSKDYFLIQDPFGLREAIQPVVSISTVEDKITGLGTCFQISPWGWMTAHHVVLHKDGNPFPPNEVGCVGFSPGLIYGSVGFVTTDYFGEIAERRVYLPTEQPNPLGIPGPKPPSIILDVAVLRVVTSNLKKAPLRSPLPLANTPVKVGDEVLGIGYPILGSTYKGADQPMLFEERMYGAAGVVKEIFPKGRGATQPWPTFRIEGDWRSGMSGGPVVNLKGEVCGVISRSLAPTGTDPGIGYAVHIPAVTISQLAPEVDPVNPGNTLCLGIIEDGKLVGVTMDAAEAELIKIKAHADNIAPVRFNAKTDEWITV